LTEGLKRILVAVLGIPLILSAIWFGKGYFGGLITLVALMGVYEFYTVAREKNLQPHIWVGMVVTPGFSAGLYFHQYQLMIALILLGTMLSLGVELVRLNSRPIENTGITVIGYLYAGLFITTLIGIRESRVFTSYQDAGIFVIMLFAGVWVCDTAAYYIGTAFGEHKLHETVSPNKSVEGAVAGFVGTLILVSGVYISPLLPDLSLPMVIFLILAVGIFGQVGDLIESWMKRASDLKDTSSLLPGHGGILDRFDSLLLVAPLTYLWCQLNIF